MIREVNHRNEYTAKSIQRIQRPAYLVEADLMGFRGIPQLNESILEIQNSGETFWGYIEQDRLMGFISYKEEGNIIDIHRLVVDPKQFRRGIGRQLLGSLMNKFEGLEFIVSTGKMNKPAKNLYTSFGFIETEDFEVAPGIFCTTLKKRNSNIELEE